MTAAASLPSFEMRDLPSAPGRRRLAFAGTMNEDADFSELELKADEVTEIDLSAVRTCNSIGILKWCRFLAAVDPRARIEFINCPAIMVHHFNLVPAFLGHPGLTVRSFEMRFVCGECQRDDGVQLDAADGRLVGESVSMPPPLCRACGSVMSIDGIAAKEFMFLKRQLAS